MKNPSPRLAASLLFATALCPLPCFAHSSETDADARAEKAVAQMTEEEKLSLMQTELLARIPFDKQPKDIAIGVGYTPGVPRLGVPLLTESDASLGVANMGGFIRPKDGATALPSAMAMGSTWDPGLIEQGGRMMGGETRAKGFNVLLAGGVNLVREPRNGRNFEYFSEDPLLSGTLAGSSIRGIQSNNIVSTMKHYVLNAQETGRSFLNVNIDEAAMRESDLLAFEIANEIGQPGSVMCSYNKVNGVHSCENDFLLNTVLRHDWGFKGWVMSDWGGVHSVSVDKGLDQESGVRSLGESYFGKPLHDTLADGSIKPSDIDRSVTRIVRTMYKLGLADHPVSVGNPIDFEANGKVAQAIAEQGIVLLKNEGNLLPVAASARKIVVIGAHADVGVPSGGGSSQVWPAGGASLSLAIPGDAIYHRRLYMPSSPLQALREQFPDADVVYDDGTDPARAAEAAKGADIAIVFAEQFMAEGHDSLDLMLPDNQNGLIEAVAAANPKTVVVLETGGPVLMPWIDKVPAVIEAWYAGQRGGHAIARVLSGAVNPSGRLPVTFPSSVDQLPNPVLPGSDRITLKPGSDLYDMPTEQEPLNVTYPEGPDVGYRWFAKQDRKPLFAFGHGLSYTNFAMSAPKLSGMTARFTVSNTGSRGGASVAQLYLVSRAGKAERRLVGYQRVELAPGAKQSATITIEPRLLADWHNGGWWMPKGEYRFALGDDAQHLDREVSVKYAERSWKEVGGKQ
ncbi:glycoside hydrolase family 3 C-terminal domain-containing protein [Novosphingobium album (ex Hu et al. 2023)]|uniref:Glycoside hydrolase family 3 C-terminal domain-containing protein n=1 Tax=Novosphingobium album (ex Hu et al. 2023) TaxID=2930093 RepID=A0ABT0B5S8_9SPHN|nr:glycoside hydrolase family 3 C-terminal domain-containing protein [Novosphingobium album (ex Hu et al. 2023)]MCJ2180226.1 glycoside hydrolase family 3 C-terminal domain-containing protein [Novosphingobium album (ex Hu et al. 2023)]